MDKLKSNKKYIFPALIVILCITIIYSLNIINKNKIINSSFEVASEEIAFSNLPSNFDGFKILQISDLHSIEFDKDNSSLINTIDELSPDVIFITGDIFSATEFKDSDDTYNRNYDEESLVGFKLLKELSKKYDIIYSVGNHEEGIDAIFNGYEWNLRDRTVDNSYNRYINKLSDLGVKFVDNSYTTIYKDVQTINIYGIYYYSLNKYAKKIDPDDPLTLDFIKTVDKNKFNILLSHDPDAADILEDKNFDLILSGHVHGGIIRLFDVGILDPARKLFPKYDKGLYKVKNTQLYVSTGLGNSKFMRINNPPEINLITLKNLK